MRKSFFSLMLLALTLLTVGTVQAAKKVHTIGDSTMAWYDENATITRGWGMYFGNFLTGGWASVNYARGGRDARSGYNELWKSAKENVEAGDYVIIQFGHNDEMFNGVDHDELAAIKTLNDSRGTNPTSTYKELLKKICDEVKAKGATPVLVSPVCRFWFDSKGKIKRSGRHDLGDSFDKIENGQLKTGLSLPADDHTMDYAYQMGQLAKAENILFVDLTAASQQLFEEYGPSRCEAELQSVKTEKGVTKADGTHFRYMGAMLIARLCAQKMKEAGILADNINVPTDLTVSPETADMGESYKGMTLTKELTINGFGLSPETGKVTITATGDVELSLDNNNWKKELSVEYSGGLLVKPFYARLVLASVGEINSTINVSDGTKNILIPVTAKGLEISTGAPVTISWPFNTDNTAKVEGPLTAEQKLMGMTVSSYSDGVQLLNVTGGTWPKAEDDDADRYTEFSMTSTSDNTLKIDNISMKVGSQGGALSCHIYYSTDNFQTRKTLKELTGMADGAMNEVAAQPIISMKKGETLQLRIYPWSEEETTGRSLNISNLVISGVEEGAGLENEPVTITYKFDKGEAGQSAAYGPKAQANSWMKSSYVEIGSNLSYLGTLTTEGVTQTLLRPATKSSAVGNAGDYIDFCFIPKKGLLFTPTKVSYKLVRNGTGGGNTKTTWVNGDGVETAIGEFTGSKADYPQNKVHSFSYNVTGVNASSGTNILRINLYSLDNNKSAGFSDIVIEGTFTGVPQNSVQYRLTTSVNIDEAGSVTVTPAGVMFDEGDQVTLTAEKNFGYKFIEWQDADGNKVSTEAETSVIMDAAKTMNAIFQKVSVYTIKTEVTNDAERELGSITLSPNEHDGLYEEGTKITATANETKILKFLNWTDENENAGAGATREMIVKGDMTLVANYEVQDFIAVFDASKTAAYATSSSYPFSADVVWDANRNAKVSIVKQSDGSLVKGTNGTPVVRNRVKSGVLTTLSGLFQNGYNTAEIAWQYQFSTVGFTAATFTADMAAKNAATKNWKAQISTDGITFTDLKAWEVTANTSTPLSFVLPAEAMGKEAVYVRIMGTGTELLATKYAFDKGTSEEGLKYASNSESQIADVYVLGTAVIADDDVAPKVTGTVPADKATGISATGRIIISYDERIESANSNGIATLNDVTLEPTWSNRSVSFNYSNLDYGKQYTFKMPAGFVQDRSGNKDAQDHIIVFTVMTRPTIEKGLYDAVVSTTEELSAAINKANSRTDKNSRFRIFVKKGTYKLPTGATKHYVHKDNNNNVLWEGDLPDPITYIKGANISLIGEDRAATIITQDISNGADMLFDGQFGKAHKYEEIANSAVFQLESSATGMYFQDITVKSGINDGLGRNLAIHDKSTNTIYKNTLLYGYQDTWTSNNNSGLYYFEGGQVRGRTDYLCGKGDAYFNGLELIQLKGGYAAVPSVPKLIGWVFKDCTFSGDGSGVSGNYTLGRPWGKGTPVAVFIDTKMNVTPSAIGWNEMSNGWPKRFAEWNSTTSTGAAVDLSGRKTVFGEGHDNNPVLTKEEADNYSDMSAMFGDWQPTLLTEQAPVPINLKAEGSVLSWTDNDYTLLWAVSCDGEIVGFTTAPTYTTTVAGSYAVRAANEMGGLSAPSEAVEVTTTVIESVTTKGTDATTVYTLDGRCVSKAGKGISIVKSTGFTGKILVK